MFTHFQIGNNEIVISTLHWFVILILEFLTWLIWFHFIFIIHYFIFIPLNLNCWKSLCKCFAWSEIYLLAQCQICRCLKSAIISRFPLCHCHQVGLFWGSLCFVDAWRYQILYSSTQSEIRCWFFRRNVVVNVIIEKLSICNLNFSQWRLICTPSLFYS